MPECVMRKKRIPHVLVHLVICLHVAAKIRVMVYSELSEEFDVNIWMH